MKPNFDNKHINHSHVLGLAERASDARIPKYSLRGKNNQNTVFIQNPRVRNPHFNSLDLETKTDAFHALKYTCEYFKIMSNTYMATMLYKEGIALYTHSTLISSNPIYIISISHNILHAHNKMHEKLWLEQRVVIRSLLRTQPLINHSFHSNHTIHMQIKQYLQFNPQRFSKVINFL